MRIRKRFPPSSSFSSSLSLSSDPQLSRSPVVQHQLHGSTQPHPPTNLGAQLGNNGSQPSDPPNQPTPQPSDQHPPIRRPKARWVLSDMLKDLEDEEVKEDRRVEEESNDTRKPSILGAEVGTATSASHQEVGRWREGDKVVPPKKRRGNFEDGIMEREKKAKAKMKSKTNKKCVQIEGNDKNKSKDGSENSTTTSGVIVKKKMKRGNVIMEGSRCSRVNGRGWRCCQQTLVGYSLCEHHLGKGRLRSMTSVRSRATMGTTSTNSSSATMKDEFGKLLKSNSTLVQEKEEEKLFDEDDDDDEEEEEEKPLVVTKKRMKLGMVKARSISSLLGQTNNSVSVVADNNKNSSVM